MADKVGKIGRRFKKAVRGAGSAGGTNTKVGAGSAGGASTNTKVGASSPVGAGSTSGKPDVSSPYVPPRMRIWGIPRVRGTVGRAVGISNRSNKSWGFQFSYFDI